MTLDGAAKGELLKGEAAERKALEGETAEREAYGGKAAEGRVADSSVAESSVAESSVAQGIVNSVFRVGIGYDSHRLVEGRPLILGGIEIPFDKGLDGHSDADVVLHAITDAICGAAGLPDIGRQFPDTDETWRGADSKVLLRRVMNRAREHGWQLENVDVVLVAQRPKIAPHIEAMRRCTAETLETDVERVNIRGKTAEGLGPVGDGAGMESHAVCLLSRC